jgi:hypothetical protein
MARIRHLCCSDTAVENAGLGKGISSEDFGLDSVSSMPNVSSSLYPRKYAIFLLQFFGKTAFLAAFLSHLSRPSMALRTTLSMANMAFASCSF